MYDHCGTKMCIFQHMGICHREEGTCKDRTEKRSNADKIRQMNDDELKKFIVSISNPIAFSYVTGEDIVSEWLKRDAQS